MSSFEEPDKLICRFCKQRFSFIEEKFPADLFTYLLEKDIHQVHWFCKSCSITTDTILRDGENLHARVIKLETIVSDIQIILHKLGYYPMEDDYIKRSRPLVHSTGSPPLRTSSSSPSPVRGFRSADCSPDRNKEALRIIHGIVDNEIKIETSEVKSSISVVEAFMIQLHQYLKIYEPPVYKYLYSGNYPTGSSYNDLKISSANEYDININFILPEPFKLKVEFFKETMAFAKLKWTYVSPVPKIKECVLKFLERTSNEEFYLDPMKIKSWFQGLVDKFCLTEPKIEGIKKFTISESGPARTILIQTEENNFISLDLVPVFKFGFDIFPENAIPRLDEYSLKESKKFCSFVPKTCVGEEKLLASDCKVSWRIYVPEIDKKVMHDKQCAKSVIKLLKLLRDKQEWKSLASYYMVTVILWEINKNPDDWSGKWLYDRFIKALEMLQSYLKEKRLPYFLYPPYNLFHSLNARECEHLENCVKGIVKELKLDHNNLRKVFKLYDK